MESLRHFAFLRAINTGNRRLTNAQLLEPFVRLGYEGVDAYQAAGNVTFCTDHAQQVDPAPLEAALAESYGFDAPVFVRSAPELRTVATATPFSDEELLATEGRIQVTFMHSAPDAERTAAVHALVPAEDRVVFANREWYWLPVRGISHSALPVSAIEQLIGPMTTRTLGTVTRMLNKFT